MNRWAVRVCILYVLIIAVLTPPAIILAFGEKVTMRPKELLELFTAWQFWLLLAVLFISQYALLCTPVDVARRRPERRGPLWPTVVAGGFMAGLLFIGLVAAVVEGLQLPFESPTLLVVPALAVVSWIAWAVAFHRAGKADPARMVSRQSNWLIKGSALELLVAVPMHVLTRHRNECCAGFLTFTGLATGMAVMLFAFGPAVFFLFVERWRRLQPAAMAADE
ncbi:MAG: hypothetical protein K1X78_06420 [Verrucomicrobiaceae bacterium]|nr:hypothetical protein [Verrucomicrobiaceae bacterium]